MRHEKRIRAAFVVTVGAVAAGCGSELQIITNPPLDSGAKMDAGDVPADTMAAPTNAPGCPVSVPSMGQSCDPGVAETCEYFGGPCPLYERTPILAHCVQSAWRIHLANCTPPPDRDGGDATDADASVAPDADAAGGACPASPPMPGSACTPTTSERCNYSFPCPGGAYPSTAAYECSAGRWSLSGAGECNPPFDGGASGDVPGGG